MVLRTEGLACWRGTSRYLATLGWRAMVSRRRVVTLLGVGVEEAEPAEAGEGREGVEELGEAFGEA